MRVRREEVKMTESGGEEERMRKRGEKRGGGRLSTWW
jgi:hypothetical protein